VSIPKLLIVSLICVLAGAGCQPNLQAVVQEEVAAAAAATVAVLPTWTPNSTLTPQPTFSPLPTYTPASSPTLLPTLTARPTYTPNPTYTAVGTAVATTTATATSPGTVVANSTESANTPPNNAATFNAAFVQVTYAQMSQIIRSVSGYEDTYKDDDPNDLQSGEGGQKKIPVNCGAAINQFQQLLGLEVKSVDSQNPNEQAAFGFYRQAWEQYMSVAVPIIDRCQTAVANNETLDTLGPDLYGAAVGVLLNDVNALINQAITTLGENQ